MDKKSATVAVALVGGLTVLSFLFALGLSSGGGSGASKKTGPRIGVVEIKGMITGSKKALRELVDLREDESIKAIVVRIDSPGGSVGPSQEIYAEIVRTKGKKKVVASLGNLAASGGYYIAAAADKIVANPGTITGSIGVITSLPNFSELLALSKVSVEVIKSGPLKDAGSPLRKLSPEDRGVFEKLIEDIHGQFVADVAKGRSLPEEKVRAIADGRVISGRQAKEHKLVDQLGNIRDAAALAAQLGGAKAGDPVLVYPRAKDRSFLKELLKDGVSGAAAAIRDEVRGLARGGVRVEARDPVLSP